MASVTILWPMIAATSLTLGMVHLMVWWQNREKPERLWFFFMTVATAGMAFTELAMMKSGTGVEFGSALRWNHVPVWLNFFAVIGFLLIYMQAGRLWLAGLAIGVRTVTLGINFWVHPNINFREITGVRQVAFLGDEVSLAIGKPNPLMALAQSGLLLVLLFTIDVSITVWRRGERKRALLVGGSMVLFRTVSDSYHKSLTMNGQHAWRRPFCEAGIFRRHPSTGPSGTSHCLCATAPPATGNQLRFPAFPLASVIVRVAVLWLL